MNRLLLSALSAGAAAVLSAALPAKEVEIRLHPEKDIPARAAFLARHLSAAGQRGLRLQFGERDPEITAGGRAGRTRASLLRPRSGALDFRISVPEADAAAMARYPTGAGTTQSETNIAATGPHVVVGYNDSASLYTHTSTLSGYSVSHDGGTTWTGGLAIPAVPGSENLGDPGLAADRHGNFYYAQVVFYASGVGRYTLGVAKSTNGGSTFGLPVDVWAASPPADTVPGPLGETTQSISDKELIAVDNSGGPHDGTVYVAWAQFAATYYPNADLTRVTTQMMLTSSSDGGATWSAPVPVSTQRMANYWHSSATGSYVSGAVLGVGPGGEVYVGYEEAFYTMGFPSIERIARSDDGGATFALSEKVVANVNQIGNPNMGIVSGAVRVNEFPDMAVDPRSGTLYMVYNSAPTPWPGTPTNPGGADRSDIYLVHSTDKGQTWSAPLRVNDDATSADQFFPAIAVAPSGAVAMMWYDRRNDPYNQRFDVYMAQTADGVTLSPCQRITSVSSPLVQTTPNFDPILVDSYMGDYNDIGVSGNRFVLAWGDNRDLYTTGDYGPRPDPNIYFAAVPFLGRR